MQKIKTYLAASRPISWVNTAYPFAATYLIAERQASPALVVGTLFFLIPYNFMLYGVNDVFDYESDLLNARKGGIEGAVVAKAYHRGLLLAVAATNLPFIVYFLAIGNGAARGVFAAVIFLALAYSLPKLRFKERPFIDSLTSSLHFACPLLYAVTLTGWRGYYLPYALAFLFWGMASHAFGAVQDIIPDRKAGIASIATKMGARRTVRFAMLCYLICAGLLAATGTYGLIAAVVALLYVANIARYHAVSDEQSEITNRAWRRFIYLNLFAGFIITLEIIFHLLSDSG